MAVHFEDSMLIAFISKLVNLPNFAMQTIMKVFEFYSFQQRYNLAVFLLPSYIMRYKIHLYKGAKLNFLVK